MWRVGAGGFWGSSRGRRQLEARWIQPSLVPRPSARTYATCREGVVGPRGRLYLTVSSVPAAASGKSGASGRCDRVDGRSKDTAFAGHSSGTGRVGSGIAPLYSSPTARSASACGPPACACAMPDLIRPWHGMCGQVWDAGKVLSVSP
jgi:hypothetical protein